MTRRMSITTSDLAALVRLAARIDDYDAPGAPSSARPRARWAVELRDIVAAVNRTAPRRTNACPVPLSGVALDVETGGLDPDTCALLRVGVALVHRGRVIERHDWHVTPGAGLVMEADALAVNMWQEHPAAAREAEVLERLAGVLRRLSPRRPLATIGHNVAWDIAVLRAVARRNGLPPLDLPHRFADSAVLALPYQLTGELPSRRLDDLVPALLGRPRSPDAHVSPLIDAEDALEVVLALCRRATWTVACA